MGCERRVRPASDWKTSVPAQSPGLICAHPGRRHRSGSSPALWRSQCLGNSRFRNASGETLPDSPSSVRKDTPGHTKTARLQRVFRCDWHTPAGSVLKGCVPIGGKTPVPDNHRANAAEVRGPVRPVKPSPNPPGDLLAALVFKLKSLLRHLAPLPQDVFALARAHGAQKIVEITITPVVPVELTAQTLGCRQGN